MEIPSHHCFFIPMLWGASYMYKSSTILILAMQSILQHSSQQAYNTNTTKLQYKFFITSQVFSTLHCVSIAQPRQYCLKDMEMHTMLEISQIKSLIQVCCSCSTYQYNKKKNCVSSSTTKSEYVATCSITKDIIWHYQLFTNLHYQQSQAMHILYNNQSIIWLIHNPKFYQ